LLSSSSSSSPCEVLISGCCLSAIWESLGDQTATWRGSDGGFGGCSRWTCLGGTSGAARSYEFWKELCCICIRFNGWRRRTVWRRFMHEVEFTTCWRIW
jgi:hypothetical protein